MADYDFERARHLMIEQQLRTWDVLDEQVLEVIRTTPRENFVPEQYRTLALTDMRIPLPHGQVMIEPKMEARMLQEVEPHPEDEALVIGTGSGYLVACLAQMVAHVTTVELFEDISAQAAEHLKSHDIENVTLVVGDAGNGWDDGRRYDVIIVTGSLPKVPQSLAQSMAVGGRMFIVVGQEPVMEALLLTRTGEDSWTSDSLFDTCIKRLENVPEERKFAL